MLKRQKGLLLLSCQKPPNIFLSSSPQMFFFLGYRFCKCIFGNCSFKMYISQKCIFQVKSSLAKPPKASQHSSYYPARSAETPTFAELICPLFAVQSFSPAGSFVMVKPFATATSSAVLQARFLYPFFFLKQYLHAKTKLVWQGWLTTPYNGNF